METKKNLTLVIGGTGKTGRRVTQRLQSANYPVRIGSRTANPSFDWNNQETWKPSLQDVDSVYLTYYPDLAIPGAVETVRAFANQAKDSGVNHLVLLSGRGEEEAQNAEQVIQQSGIDWTILRCSWFSQNFSENFLSDAINSGEVFLPVDKVKEPFIDADDIADVAFAALTEEGHKGQLYELTGPRLISFAEAVDEISKATGNKIQFIPISMEDYNAALSEQNLPEEFSWLINYLFTTVLDGRNEYLTDGVQRALGREAKDFSFYAQETANTGAWG